MSEHDLVGGFRADIMREILDCRLHRGAGQVDNFVAAVERQVARYNAKFGTMREREVGTARKQIRAIADKEIKRVKSAGVVDLEAA